MVRHASLLQPPPSVVEQTTATAPVVVGDVADLVNAGMDVDSE